MGRIFNRRNLIPLFLVPVVLWSYDLLVHILFKQMQEPNILIILLNLTFPILSYFLTGWLYRLLSAKLSTILPPEIPGFLGLLYTQPIYMIFLKLAINGNLIALTKENIINIAIATATVPYSTIVFSTYDLTLLAVPFTFLAMLIAGKRYRRKYRV